MGGAWIPRFLRERHDRERRERGSQREAIDNLLSRATGATALVRCQDGSVFVYDEHRDWSPPATMRVRVTSSGDMDPPERLKLSVA